MRLLIVDEPQSIRKRLKRELDTHGYLADFVHSSADAELLVTAGHYDALVLNVALLGTQASLVIQAARSKGWYVFSLEDIPRKTPWPDGVQPDYVLNRPVSALDLLPKLHVLRRERRALQHNVLRLGSLIVDLERHQTVRSGHLIRLSTQEFRLLALLLRHEGEVLSRTYIVEQLWGLNSVTASNIVDVVVLRLRRKINRRGEPNLIHTVRGSGYCAELA